GQVNVTFRSKPLLPMVADEFRRKKKPSAVALKDLLGGDAGTPDFHLVTTGAVGKPNMPHVVCVSGGEGVEWRNEDAFVGAVEAATRAWAPCLRQRLNQQSAGWPAKRSRSAIGRCSRPQGRQSTRRASSPGCCRFMETSPRSWRRSPRGACWPPPRRESRSIR